MAMIVTTCVEEEKRGEEGGDSLMKIKISCRGRKQGNHGEGKEGVAVKKDSLAFQSEEEGTRRHGETKSHA